MRIVLIALAIAVVIVALWAVRRLRRGPWASGAGAAHELVKDPVCGIYVVRSRAVARTGGEGSRYFCSRECASRFGG